MVNQQVCMQSKNKILHNQTAEEHLPQVNRQVCIQSKYKILHNQTAEEHLPQ